MKVISLVLAFVAITSASHIKGNFQDNNPPHCIEVTKKSDFIGLYKINYPTKYIAAGEIETFQPLLCVNPAAVSVATTKVCDWTAPPLVQFTLDDEYLHVYRLDRTGQFSGKAVITTTQWCNHNVSSDMAKKFNVTLTEMQ